MPADSQYQLVVEASRAATSAASLDECTSRLAELLLPAMSAESIALWRLSRDGTSIQPASISNGESASMARRPLGAAAAARLRDVASSGHAKVIVHRDGD